MRRRAHRWLMSAGALFCWGAADAERLVRANRGLAGLRS